MPEEVKVSVPVIDRVIELQPARVLDVEGYRYLDKDKSLTLFKPPVPELLTLATLGGFVELLELRVEDFDAGGVFVQVRAYDRVSLFQTVSDRYGRRQEYVTAIAAKPERTFEFGSFMPQEQFNIGLRTMFVQTPELDALVALAGNIAKESEVRQEDDGFGQRVTVKNGVALVKEKTIAPRVRLQPYRTFLEVEQPTGDYIFRVRHDDLKGNLCALFEADAGAWKLQAMNTVRDWLRNRLHGSAVEAVIDLPVIA